MIRPRPPGPRLLPVAPATGVQLVNDTWYATAADGGESAYFALWVPLRAVPGTPPQRLIVHLGAETAGALCRQLTRQLQLAALEDAA